jgi:hypothetical protein
MPRAFDPRPIARAFWARAGKAEPFPRQLRQAIASSLPVAVVTLPNLTLRGAARWLECRGAAFSAGSDRPLRGLLVAQRGHGFIFLDGTMSADEERMTLAHEIAHFIHHYLSPRSAALAVLGESVRPVLDGDRLATTHERLSGVLREVPISTFTHMLDRSDRGLPTEEARTLEVEADLIGFELLAPSDRVAASTRSASQCRDFLQEMCGLPPKAAAAWCGWIQARREPDSFITRLEDHRKKNWL